MILYFATKVYELLRNDSAEVSYDKTKAKFWV